MLHNEGRRPMYIGGKAVMARTSAKLVHNQVLEVGPITTPCPASTLILNLQPPPPLSLIAGSVNVLPHSVEH